MEKKHNLLADKKLPTKELFLRTMKYFRPEMKRFILGFLLIILNVAFDVITPICIMQITNNLKSENPLFSIIVFFSIGFLILVIIGSIINYLENVVLMRAGQNIVLNLRLEVFSHIESMSQNQINDMPVGSLVTRVCNYTTQVADFFASTMVNIIRYILTAVSVYVIMFIISWKLSLIMLGIVIVIFVISYFFSTYVHKIFKQERNDLSDLNAFLNESLSGMKTIQIYNAQDKSEATFNQKNEKYRKTRIKANNAFAVYRPLISFLNIVSIGLILFLGTIFALSAAEIVGFYLYISKFFNPIQNLADELNHIQRALTAMERLFNLLDIKPEVTDKDNLIEKTEFAGKIEFRNVYFAYEKENWILKNVSFTINPKETVAFVGVTGAGKSTILGLIVRNFEPQKGDIFIDDINIKDIPLSNLRNAIGQMLQDVFLFTGTIRENITLFDKNYTDEEIMAASDYVNLTPVIKQLNNGLDEEVIERGENFSAGQRQLLSFARTVLHKPQIIILDEATANIDTETEVVIQNSLEKIKNIGTMLIVAHRLSTIQHSDKIIVISNGEVLEEGNHQELLKNHGYYYNLYMLQFKNEGIIN